MGLGLSPPRISLAKLDRWGWAGKPLRPASKRLSSDRPTTKDHPTPGDSPDKGGTGREPIGGDTPRQAPLLLFAESER